MFSVVVFAYLAPGSDINNHDQQDWHQFAKQHALDGPTTVQELKVQRLQDALGNLPDPVQSSDVKVRIM